MLLLFLLLASTVPGFSYQLSNKTFEWHQLNLGDVCFECTGNKYGTIHNMLSEAQLVAAMKLVYRGGNIRCTTNTAYNSRWGCHKGGKTTLNVVITDWKNNLIYPRSDYIKDWGALWYSMPGVDDLHSRELVFSNFGVPFYLERYRDLRIWCGEDLKDSSDGDNQGRVCVDVYVKYY